MGAGPPGQRHARFGGGIGARLVLCQALVATARYIHRCFSLSSLGSASKNTHALVNAAETIGVCRLHSVALAKADDTKRSSAPPLPPGFIAWAARRAIIDILKGDPHPELPLATSEYTYALGHAGAQHEIAYSRSLNSDSVTFRGGPEQHDSV